MGVTGFTSEGIDFGHAIAAAKQGKCVAREGWNGKDMFVFIRPADELSVGVLIHQVKSLPQTVKDYYYKKVEGSFEAHTTVKVRFCEYLCMKAADNSIVNGWVPSQTDMLANDWQILD